MKNPEKIEKAEITTANTEAEQEEKAEISTANTNTKLQPFTLGNLAATVDTSRYKNKVSDPILEQYKQENEKEADDIIFRISKPHLTETINWGTPNSEDDRVVELPFPVIAVRGNIVKSSAGLVLFNSEGLVCKTIGMKPIQGESIRGSRPMPRPIYSPEKWNTPGTPVSTLQNLNPIGMRGESCVDCVRQKHNYNDEEVDGITSTSSCGLSFSLLFCVWSIGLLITSPRDRKLSVKWISYDQFFYNEDGQIVYFEDLKKMEGDKSKYERVYDKPFIVNNYISRTPVMRRSKKLSLDTKENGGIIPNDVYPFDEFFGILQSTNQVNAIEEQDNGNKYTRYVFEPIIEMWSSHDAHSSANPKFSVRSFPVFRSVNTYNHEESLAATEYSWRVYCDELEKVGHSPVPQPLAATTIQKLESTNAKEEDENNAIMATVFSRA